MGSPTNGVKVPEHGCPRCDKRWNGTNTAHCGFGCHETFTGMTAFDKHQKSGKCREPLEAGLEPAGRAYPCWTTPERVKPAHDPLEGEE